MKIPERDLKVAKAWRELNGLLIDWMKKHELTAAEELTLWLRLAADSAAALKKQGRRR